MTATDPTIVATSGGFARPARGDLALAPLVAHAVELARPADRPRVAYLGTASGDQRWHNALVAEAGTRAGYDLDVVNLFPMPSVDDLEAHLLAQDVVWVGGGSVANLLAVWRVHGLDVTFRRAWESGVVLGGVSAGSICWFRGGTTDSFGRSCAPSPTVSACSPSTTASTSTPSRSDARRCTVSSPRASSARPTAPTTGPASSTAAPSSSRR